MRFGFGPCTDGCAMMEKLPADAFSALPLVSPTTTPGTLGGITDRAARIERASGDPSQVIDFIDVFSAQWKETISLPGDASRALMEPGTPSGLAVATKSKDGKGDKESAGSPLSEPLAEMFALLPDRPHTVALPAFSNAPTTSPPGAGFSDAMPLNHRSPQPPLAIPLSPQEGIARLPPRAEFVGQKADNSTISREALTPPASDRQALTRLPVINAERTAPTPREANATPSAGQQRLAPDADPSSLTDKHAEQQETPTPLATLSGLQPLPVVAIGPGGPGVSVPVAAQSAWMPMAANARQSMQAANLATPDASAAMEDVTAAGQATQSAPATSLGDIRQAASPAIADYLKQPVRETSATAQAPHPVPVMAPKDVGPASDAALWPSPLSTSMAMAQTTATDNAEPANATPASPPPLFPAASAAPPAAIIPPATPSTAPAGTPSPIYAAAPVQVYVDMPAHSPLWGNALGERVVWLVENGQQQARLHINPEHLGPIDVTVTLNGGEVAIAFNANQPEIRGTLDAALPQLRDSLTQNGVQLGSTTVSADSRGTRDDRQGQSTSARFFTRQAALDDTPSTPGTRNPARVTSGLLDTYA